jgi:hypothetical protein
MRPFVVHDFLVAFAVTMLLGTSLLLLMLAAAILSAPTSMEAKRPATWSVEELQK